MKIDIPFGATKNTEWKITHQSNLSYYSSTINTPAVNSKIKDSIFKIDYNEKELEDGSDISVIVKEKKISITPLTLNLTANLDFRLLKNKMT